MPITNIFFCQNGFLMKLKHVKVSFGHRFNHKPRVYFVCSAVGAPLSVNVVQSETSGNNVKILKEKFVQKGKIVK